MLAVPAIRSANSKTKERILVSKITTAEQGLLAWNHDNENCFRDSNAIDCIVGLNKGCTVDENIVSCSITIGELASNNIIDYDKLVDGVKVVTSPVDNTSINDYEFSFKYDSVKRIFLF